MKFSCGMAKSQLRAYLKQQLTITADVSSDEGRVTESHGTLGQIRLFRVTQVFWTDRLLLFYKNYSWTWQITQFSLEEWLW